MSSGGTVGADAVPVRARRVRAPRVSAPAWGALGIVALFVATTAWWLSQDAAVQFGGGASQLYASILFQEDLWGSLGLSGYYPPLIRVFGALALTLGGDSVAAPVLAQNLVFVPLLALACFQVGRMVAGPRAGLLAVVFALGSPLIAEQFHLFMLDAPQAALVAVAVWLILASDRFARTDRAALAGVVVGLGLLTKQLMPLFLVGLLAAVLLRGDGWRNWRGIAAFAGAAFVVAAPWYLAHVGDWARWGGAAGQGEASEPVPEAAAPALLSLANAGWYLWGTLNGLLLAALFAIAATGVVVTAVQVLRSRPRPLDDVRVELLWGLAGAWLAITVLQHKDVRYTMSLIVFLAVLGTAWMVNLRPRLQGVAIAALLVAVLAAQLGATFGVGRDPDQLPLSNGATQEGEGVPPRDRVVVYTALGYLVSGPRESGDLQELFERLREQGVARIAWEDRGDVNDHLFEAIGLLVFLRFAGLATDAVDPPGPGPTATLIRAYDYEGTAPCRQLANGTGVWVRIGERDACPGPAG